MLLLSGCSAVGSGQAAISEEFQVSQADVDAEVRAALEGLGQPPGEPPSGWALATTQRLVRDALVQAKAADLGVQVTQAEIEQGVAGFAASYGGLEALEQAALQSGIPVEALDDFVRSALLVEEIGQVLEPSADAAAQQAATSAELAEYSDEIGLEVSPRYGTWNSETLEIVPGSTVAEPADAEPATP
jgi:parvulin-like peptidyl-prolyl isomerase